MSKTAKYSHGRVTLKYIKHLLISASNRTPPQREHSDFQPQSEGNKTKGYSYHKNLPLVAGENEKQYRHKELPDRCHETSHRNCDIF